MSQLFSKLLSEGGRQKAQMIEAQSPAEKKARPDKPLTANPTRHVTPARDTSREISRHTRDDLPTRDEVQEFSFRLRDDWKVKVQAEVPYPWQAELEDIARRLKVKKLELYRFILGEFLGKVKQGREERDHDA